MIFYAAGTCPSRFEMPYEAGWANYGGSFGSAFGCRSDEGLVVLHGLASGDTANRNIARLPEGYRPSSQLMFNQNANSAINRIDVTTDGYVYWDAGVFPGWTSFAGIAFFASDAEAGAGSV